MIHTIHRIRFYLSKSLPQGTIKRFMFHFKLGFSKGTQLLPKNTGPYYDFIRNPSFLAQGSFVYGEERHDLSVISYSYVNFLVNYNVKDSYDMQMLLFINQIVGFNLKMFQHFFDILHSTDSIAINILRVTYPKLVIENISQNLNASNACVITSSIANQIKETSHLFVTGKMTVLDFGGENAKMNARTQEAYEQTSQPHPDLFYEHKKNDIIIWSRYYDIKSGNFNVNDGHLIPTSNVKIYEFLSEKILNGQYQCYKDIPEIKSYLKTLFKNKSLTWSDRSQLFQLFIRDNLQLYPEINPSFPILIPLEYNLAQERNMRCPLDIGDTECFININTSKITAARTLIFKGKAAVDKYNLLPSHDKEVFAIASRLLKELLS
jgi:hypothetical protein